MAFVVFFFRLKKWFPGFLLLASSVLGAEPPYQGGQLKDIFALKDSEVRSAVSEIKLLKGTKRQPSGTVFECYQDGAGSIDQWLSIPTLIYTAPPPSAPSYYRFVYHDGYPISMYRHKGGKTSLTKAYYYDQKMRLALSVLFNPEAKPLRYFLLSHDNIGRIKRVIAFDADFKPLDVHCFYFPGAAGVLEKRRYSLVRGGRQESHIVMTPDAEYFVQNGERIKDVHNKRAAAFEEEFSKFGIKPFYPVPTS